MKRTALFIINKYKTTLVKYLANRNKRNPKIIPIKFIPLFYSLIYIYFIPQSIIHCSL